MEGNTFFDTIYIQDDTAGIDIFPYAESGLAIGTKVEITGYVDAYQGDKELKVISSRILDEEPKVIAPEKLSAKDAMDYEKSGGKLVQVEGTVTDVLYDAAGTSSGWMTAAASMPIFSSTDISYRQRQERMNSHRLCRQENACRRSAWSMHIRREPRTRQ